MASEVFPISGSTIDHFEDPPDWGGGDEQQNEIAPRANPKRIASPARDQGIHHEDIAEPKREEEVGCPQAGKRPV